MDYHNSKSHESNSDHDEHAGHSVAMFRNRFWLSLVLTIPVMLYSEMIQDWLGFQMPVFIGSEYIPFIFSSVIFLYGGMVFIKGAASEIKNKLPGMMTLISLAIITAYAYSVATQFLIDGESFFWELASLVSIMLLGHWIEMASIERAGDALQEIAKLLPDEADRIEGDAVKTVKVSELDLGDMVLVRPGASIPVDGEIVDGSSDVDLAAITGESAPVFLKKGDEVVAGAVNQDGSLVVRVSKLGDDTALAGIMKMVAEASASKSRAQVLADRAAFWLTIVAVVSALATFAYWLIARDASFALERLVTVLIIACPHALGLAIPLVVSISTGMAARNGLLVRRRIALESARDLDWVIFDKTGTLTTGQHKVNKIWSSSGYSEDRVISLAAAIENHSEHALGRSIIEEARARQLAIDISKNFKALLGRGVEADIDKVRYAVVSRRFLDENKIITPKELDVFLDEESKEGSSVVFLVENSRVVIGAVSMKDEIRPESIEAVRGLKKLGIRVSIISGDSKAATKAVADALMVDEYFAEVLPEGKATKVGELQSDSSRVAFVGDGINDAPALARADVGIAIGAGTDVAIKSADILLVNSNPKDVLRAVRLSRLSYRKMVQNLLWATAYNIVAIPLAAGALISVNIMITPAVAAVLMTISTVVVAINAQTIRHEL